MGRQGPSEEAAAVAAVGALVVAPLLVHRARVPVVVTRRRELGEAVRAGVHVEMRALALLFLSDHDSPELSFSRWLAAQRSSEDLAFVRSAVIEMT